MSIGKKFASAEDYAWYMATNSMEPPFFAAREALSYDNLRLFIRHVSRWCRDFDRTPSVVDREAADNLPTTTETELRDLVEAVTKEVNEKGGSGFLLARLSNARDELKKLQERRGQ